MCPKDKNFKLIYETTIALCSADTLQNKFKPSSIYNRIKQSQFRLAS